jgi:hypothetical protein
MTVSPYREPLVYPQGERSAASVRSHFTKLGYPPALVDILVQYRKLSHLPKERTPGKLDGGFLEALGKQRHTLVVEELRSDWISDMDQADGL